MQWASCRRMGILVERASWWNWHLGRTGILVELASCQFQYIFERAGCPLYSYSFKDSATPKNQHGSKALAIC
ncbi:MAG: hypothetical protein F6J90_02670 [Moorea sp. SIOASIH]|uniref:hypothetical protein n=1 Tax=Moorena sp. SIOASIH TaxID=2607817 RepID=UPI0013B620FA|nr:hypothetical protein [Moorena sp. SIOASIH]NEO35268.1 hypothetical protein [Moorena sp. SIOASIH]